MNRTLVLASASAVRHRMLSSAGIAVTVHPARVDETAIMASLVAEKATARDVADTLAEMKAAQVARKWPDALVLGCDQVLECRGKLFEKPGTLAAAREQLLALRGQTHHLFSALVLYDSGQPVWRHVAEAKLTMNEFSDSYLAAYLGRNWPAIEGCVGSYQMEAEGVQLFRRIEGDHFTILGLPLLPLIAYLAQRGFLAT